MKYRVFVASTFQDLKSQRQHVIDRLREANLDVVAMEDGTAAPDHPADASVKLLNGCHFCVAIVAFQLGTVASNDPRKRSITQIEIEAAQAKGVPVLLFLLEDTVNNRAIWPPEFNRLSDEAVIRWRSAIAFEKRCKLFVADGFPDPLPAILIQISVWEQRRRRFLQAILAAMLLAGISVLLIAGISSKARELFLIRFLAFHDPVVFHQPFKGDYQIARLLEGSSEIRAANFKETIREAHRSFSMLANNLGSFEDNRHDYEEAASRGVTLRFILTDFSKANRPNWTSFMFATMDDTPPSAPSLLAEENATVGKAFLNYERIHDLIKRFPSNVALRLNDQPLLFTLWVRDPQEVTGEAHLGVNLYGAKANWPAFRVSDVTGGSELHLLADQFERVWAMSRPDSGLTDLSK
jgi:hypothetical protein